MVEIESPVIIVGAGPSGLAVAACLSLASVPFLILEKDDCTASLWRKRTYDRVKLHLAKRFCALPHAPHPASVPTYIPKDRFLNYLDEYAARFRLRPQLRTNVEAASYDAAAERWVLYAREEATGEKKAYSARLLVAATGENGEPFVPRIPGLESFGGEVVHSSGYKSAVAYVAKRVLVVGCGNSGMEIAYDLATFGAKVAITIRNPFHVVTKEMIHMGMVLLQYLPISLVDALVVALAKLKFGDLSKYGIIRPTIGPFLSKQTTGHSPVIDVGTIDKIKTMKIQVVSEIIRISGTEVLFSNGQSHYFDAIIFATGYRSSANRWLMVATPPLPPRKLLVKDKGQDLDEEGLPLQGFPHHWKGKNGVYFAGFSKTGIDGISMDAQKIANDVEMKLRVKETDE